MPRSLNKWLDMQRVKIYKQLCMSVSLICGKVSAVELHSHEIYFCDFNVGPKNKSCLTFIIIIIINNKTLFRHRQIRDCCPVHGCVHTLK